MPSTVHKLYRSMLGVARELDSIDPARKALFLGLPRAVWDEQGQRQVKLDQMIKKQGAHTYESIVQKFNSGIYFGPLVEKNVVDVVRRAFRSKVAKLDSNSFEALREMQLVLSSAKKLPQRKRHRKREQSLKIVSGMRQINSATGRLLVGHPLASVTTPLLHRSLVVLDSAKRRGDVRGLVLNRPTQKTVRSAINPNWGKQHFGELLDQKLWVGGTDFEQGFSIVHKWRGINKSRELIPGLYVTDLHEAFSRGDYTPLYDIREKIKEENIPQNEVSGHIRILIGSCVWPRSELELLIGNNSWITVDAPSAESCLQDFCLNNRRCDYDAWKAVLNATDARALSGIPPLDSPFGESFRTLLEVHHRKVQALRDSALSER